MTSPTTRTLALSVLLPGFTGTTPPLWVRRALAEGMAGVCLFGQNVEGPEQLRALTRALRVERRDVLVASDEEGGSVTRLDAVPGDEVGRGPERPHPDDGVVGLGVHVEHRREHEVDPGRAGLQAEAARWRRRRRGRREWQLRATVTPARRPAG